MRLAAEVGQIRPDLPSPLEGAPSPPPENIMSDSTRPLRSLPYQLTMNGSPVNAFVAAGAPAASAFSTDVATYQPLRCRMLTEAGRTQLSSDASGIFTTNGR